MTKKRKLRNILRFLRHLKQTPNYELDQKTNIELLTEKGKYWCEECYSENLEIERFTTTSQIVEIECLECGERWKDQDSDYEKQAKEIQG